ncbi:MAG TPA: substrate-binding domain-containing protein [Gemmataceae bacterium]|nr:substrate-binding domain-containing protein [Gemmataceae bacterium]
MLRSGLGCLVIGLLGIFSLQGCKPSQGTPAKYRIAVIPKGTSHDFWKYIHAGAKHAERERGNTKILWDGPAKEDLRHEQQQIVERFTSDRVDAIILAPSDRRTLTAPVEAAITIGIPVVIIDSGLELTDTIRKSDNYLGYVATDNRQGGVEAAKRMIDLLNGKERAKVVMVRYQAGSESTEQREAGFRETIKPASNIAFSEAPDEAGATVDSAQQVAERLLSDHKDIDGIFVPNESSTTGFLRALEVFNRAGEIKLVGFDANKDLVHALRLGKLHGLVLQDPFDMGYQSVQRALDHLQGKGLPKERVKNTNLKMVTRENMEDPAIKLLYDRDLAGFLDE